MTPEETQKLADLQSAYDLALKNYNAEKVDNYNWYQGWGIAGNTPGGYYGGHPNEYWASGVKSSNASLELKKGLLDSTKANLDAFKKQLSQNALNALAESNPALYTQTVTAQAQADAAAQAEIEKAKIEAENAKTKAAFVAGNTKYYIVGAVLVVIVIGVIVYLRSKKGNKIPA